jgi:hypothetical protein
LNFVQAHRGIERAVISSTPILSVFGLFDALDISDEGSSEGFEGEEVWAVLFGRGNKWRSRSGEEWSEFLCKETLLKDTIIIYLFQSGLSYPDVGQIARTCRSAAVLSNALLTSL